MLLNALGLVLLAYGLGSLPFGVWVGRLVTGRDIRSSGSGHSGGTNAARQGGWPLGLTVAILDVAKGALAVYLALQWGQSPWMPALAAVAAVCGHCWPVFAGFRGGMGLSALGGGLLILAPWMVLVGLALTVGGMLVLRHAARGNVFAGVLFGPVAWLLTGSPYVALAAGGSGLVIALRSVADWKRVYTELWLDRPPKPPTGGPTQPG